MASVQSPAVTRDQAHVSLSKSITRSSEHQSPLGFLGMCLNHPETSLGPTAKVSNLEGPGKGLQICISNKVSGDVMLLVQRRVLRNTG